MNDFIKADSLAFVSIDGLYRALGEEVRDEVDPQYCDACFTGDYPTTPDRPGGCRAARPAAARRTLRRLMAGRVSTGKLALVTGASRGIGAATAEALAREGAHVVLTARNAAGLEAVEDRIHAAGGAATIAPMDLDRAATASPGSPRRSAGRWDALDILVLNAAMLGTLTPVRADRRQGIQPGC